MIILISAIILLGIVTYYFHRRDLKKQVEEVVERLEVVSEKASYGDFWCTEG